MTQNQEDVRPLIYYVEDDKKQYTKEYLRRGNLGEVVETGNSRYIQFNSQLELEGALRRVLRDAPEDIEYSIPPMKGKLVSLEGNTLS